MQYTIKCNECEYKNECSGIGPGKSGICHERTRLQCLERRRKFGDWDACSEYFCSDYFECVGEVKNEVN